MTGTKTVLDAVYALTLALEGLYPAEAAESLAHLESLPIAPGEVSPQLGAVHAGTVKALRGMVARVIGDGGRFKA